MLGSLTYRPVSHDMCTASCRAALTGAVQRWRVRWTLFSAPPINYPSALVENCGGKTVQHINDQWIHVHIFSSLFASPKNFTRLDMNESMNRLMTYSVMQSFCTSKPNPPKSNEHLCRTEARISLLVEDDHEGEDKERGEEHVPKGEKGEGALVPPPPEGSVIIIICTRRAGKLYKPRSRL